MGVGGKTLSVCLKNVSAFPNQNQLKILQTHLYAKFGELGNEIMLTGINKNLV